MYQVKLLKNIPVSKVQQIVSAIAKDVDAGVLPRGAKLPSINRFSEENSVARDTIEKAYKQLRSTGYVASAPGRGYYVAGSSKKLFKVLLIFNKLSSFKKVLYDAFVETLGKRAEVDLRIHNHDPMHLRRILQANLGRYDYYVIMPHFYSGTKEEEYLSALRLIPGHQLVLLDKAIKKLPDVLAVYQDFQNDIYEALQSSWFLLKKYRSITLILPDDIHHPREIVQGISSFCQEYGLSFFQLDSLKQLSLRKNTVYITTEEEDLAGLLKKIHTSTFLFGTDLGIISFNETVFKELLDITVVTTDFAQMGKTAAGLMLKNNNAVVKNTFRVIHRGSL